jgi:hypothetical protein
MMHMTWVKYVCGRLKSDFRYSNSIVYNNYPFPEDISQKLKSMVEKAAQNVLMTRGFFHDSNLAELYDPIKMPPELARAHQVLDKAVDACYRPKPFSNESERIEFLFDLYDQYTNQLFAKDNKKKTKQSA